MNFDELELPETSTVVSIQRSRYYQLAIMRANVLVMRRICPPRSVG